MDKQRLPKIIADKKDLYALLNDAKQLYIYGAGNLAEKVLEDIPLSADKFFEGALVTNLEGNPSIVGKTIKVYAANDRNISRDSSVLVAVGHRYVDEIVSLLYKLGYTLVFVLSSALENELLAMDKMLEVEERIKQCLWRTTPHTVLDYLVVNIVDHCNLNCAGCDHFSSIADKREVSLERLKKDMSRMGELLPNRIGFVWIMGGEPLLHPELPTIIRMARASLGETKIAVMTNGILLLQQSETFWECCRENNIIIHVTKYPINVDYDACKKKAVDHGVYYEYYSGGDVVKTLYHIPLDPEGEQDALLNFMECSHVQRCCMLSEGRLYPCTVAPNIHIFNDKFDANIPLTPDDGIDIFDMKDGDQLLENLAKPMPICRFCNIRGRSYEHEWHVSTKSIVEWT